MARKSRKNMVETVEPICQFVVYNTAIYIRLSVEDNKKRGNSIETQQYIIENFIALHPEFKTYATYIDNGTTGTNFDRPEFKRMMSDVEAGKVNCIIVKDLSRLGRNVIDTGYYLERYFPQQKVRFVAINDDHDSADPKNDGIMLPLKNMINEAYSLDIAKKIRSQAHQSMKAGDYVGARPPYGYSKALDNCHKLIVDETSASVVRQIFQWAYDKMGLNTIVKKLNTQGILSPGQYGASRGLLTHPCQIGSGAWQTRTVARILADEVYTGDMVQGKMKSIDHRQYPVEEKDWIVVRNTHEPVVSREIFESVKVYRKQVAAEGVRALAKRIPYSANLLKGKIFCDCCKKPLNRERDQDRYYFRCISNDRIAGGTCTGVIIMERTLFDAIMCVIRTEVDTLLDKNKCFQNKTPALEEKQEGAKREITALKQKTEKNRGFLKGLYESLSKGIIDREDYFAMKASYTAQIQAATEKIRVLDAGIKELDVQMNQFSALANRVKHIPKNAKLTAELVERLIERIDVRSDKSIDIKFRFKNEFSQIDEVCGHA